MGYYAEQVDGEPFTIHNAGAVLTNLATTETNHGDSVRHAWVAPVAEYHKNHATDTAALFAIVTDFGFEAEQADGLITIQRWNGEKWTGSVSDFFRAFAHGTRDHVTCMFRGEDGEHWALILGPDGFREADVTVTLTIEGA